MRHFSLVLALGFVALSAAASAQIARGPIRPADGPPVSPIQIHFGTIDDLHHGDLSTGSRSGTPANQSVTLLAPDGGWVYGVTLGERSDRPCYVELHWATVDNGTLSRSSTRNSGIGSCVPTNRSKEFAGFYPSEPVGDSDNARTMLRAIDAFRVCQRNANNLIKGLELSEAYLDELGGTTAGIGASSSVSRISRPNCNDWESRHETCPSGEVLVGIEMDYETRHGRRQGFTGFTPICAEIQIGR